MFVQISEIISSFFWLGLRLLTLLYFTLAVDVQVRIRICRFGLYSKRAMLSANDLCTQYLRICSCKLLYHFLPTIDISRAELLEIVVCFSSP